VLRTRPPAVVRSVLKVLPFLVKVPVAWPNVPDWEKLLPLVVYLAMRRDSEYVAANAREALNFHLSVLIYSLCCVPLVFILIGIPLILVIGVGSLVLAIIATVKASDGLCYRYPLTLRLVS